MKYVWALLSLTLVGCEVIPDIPTFSDGGSAWQAHRQSVQTLTQWQLTGRASVSNGTEYWNLNLLWQQHGDDYQIDLTGPFGAGHVQLFGGPAGVELRDSDQHRFYSTSPEALLYEKTGVLMPVSDLRYWVLGLPGKDHQGIAAFDADGRLAKLQLNPWQVNFRRYTQLDQVSLPEKIFIIRPDKQLDIRVVVDEWSLTPTAELKP